MRIIGTGTLVVVGGHSRGVGKTAVVEHLLRMGPRHSWVAVKISAHRHAPGDPDRLLLEKESVAGAGTQTNRYLAAGARQAWLCHAAAPAMPAAAQFIADLLDGGADVIVESNRLLRHLTPDTALFVLSPPLDDWKPSSGLAAAAAHAFVLGPRSSAMPERWPIANGMLDGRRLFTLHAPAALDAWFTARHSNFAPSLPPATPMAAGVR
jgi:hypothetical protein